MILFQQERRSGFGPVLIKSKTLLNVGPFLIEKHVSLVIGEPVCLICSRSAKYSDLMSFMQLIVPPRFFKKYAAN